MSAVGAQRMRQLRNVGLDHCWNGLKRFGRRLPLRHAVHALDRHEQNAEQAVNLFFYIYIFCFMVVLLLFLCCVTHQHIKTLFFNNCFLSLNMFYFRRPTCNRTILSIRSRSSQARMPAQARHSRVLTSQVCTSRVEFMHAVMPRCTRSHAGWKSRS